MGRNDTVERPPELADVVRIGPFSAATQPFVIDSNDAMLAARLEDRLRDLRVESLDADPTVFLVARRGPSWLTHPWGVWRDGEPCETTVSHDYVTPYVLWEITRLVLERSHPLIPIHAAAVERDGRALVLAGQSHAGKSTLAGWLTARGWGFLTDELALLDLRAGQAPIVQPFWRPIGVRRPSPLDDLLSTANGDSEVLVPASGLGRLGRPASLAAIVFPKHVAGANSTLQPEAPAAAVREMAGHLPTLGREGREVFRAIVDVVSSIPTYRLEEDDLDQAAGTLATLLERGGHW